MQAGPRQFVCCAYLELRKIVPGRPLLSKK
jgi:hypothetical protein